MIRNKIWYNLVNTKFKCYYAGYLIEKYQRRSIIINSFLAVVSLSSVSAWVIWDFLPWLWAIIIAVSNILIAIKPFLHYDKKIKELHEKLTQLESIEIEYEKLFFNYDFGTINQKSCADEFFSIFEKQGKAVRTSDDILFGLDKKIKKKAETDTDRYIYNNYQTRT